MAKKDKHINTKRAPHSLESLEIRFQENLRDLESARDGYLAGLEASVEKARTAVLTLQERLASARTKVARATVSAKKNGSKSTRSKLKQVRATTLSLAESLQDARETLVDAQRKLNAAKHLDRKLAARFKILKRFEKAWEKEVQKRAAVRAVRAKKAAAKRHKTARKRAVKRSGLQ